MIVEAKVVGRALAELQVIVDISNEEPLLHLGVADRALCEKLLVGRRYLFEIEDSTVVGFRLSPP